MQIRLAEERDVAAISALYDEAREALREAGIPQWQGDYPNAGDARRDIAEGTGYVLEENGEVLAFACLAFGVEHTYDVIEQGSWQGSGDYGYLHRVAVSGKAKGKGAAGLFFEELKRQAKERGVKLIRGDTHRDNAPMQRVMAKNGLAYRGIIRVEDGTERLAYEIVLE